MVDWIKLGISRNGWRRKWQPTPIFLPGEFHGQRSLVGYSPWGCKESDMTKHTHTRTHTHRNLRKYLQLSSNLMVKNLKLPWTGNTRIQWKSLRNTASQTLPRPTESASLEVGPGNCIWASSPGDTWASWCLRNAALRSWDPRKIELGRKWKSWDECISETTHMSIIERMAN